MTNPDVTNAEEITAWTWIAGATLIAALLAAIVLGGNPMQVASIDPIDAPPIVQPMPYL